MKILCLGDFACPELNDVEILKNFNKKNDFFKDKIVITNLEGLLVKNEENLLDKYKNALFNNEKVIDVFANSKKVIFTLANNHIKDIPENFDYTLEFLKENKIGYCGASKDSVLSEKPLEFEIDDVKIAVFSHCWKVMSNVIKKKEKRIYINDISYKEFIKNVEEYKKQNPTIMVIVYFHWNFDFEKLPFPIHIDIAHKLIDVGVDMVLGGHSHLINGCEVYKGKPIVYGFGNFYIPSGKFLSRKLTYPENSLQNVALEFNTETNQSQIYLIKKNKIEAIHDLKDKYKFESGNLNEKEYSKFFEENRTKKILIPVFRSTEDWLNGIKEFYVLLRMKCIRFLKGIK